jgi:hypothetical protein
MRQIRRIAFAALTFAAFSFSSAELRADMITQTVSYGPAITDWENLFTFNKFDPSLGTLNSVTVTATSNVNFSGSVTNLAAKAESFKVTENVTFSTNNTLPDSHNTPLNFSTNSYTQSYTKLAPNTPSAFGPGTLNGTFPLETFTSSADLAGFTGAGSTFSLDGITETDILIQGAGGNVLASIATTAGETITVVYNYTPATVPEPATLAMFGIGGLGLCLYRRTRAA